MYDSLCLTTCFDTLEDERSDEEARLWIRKALDAKVEIARFVADRRGQGPATELVGYLKGSFNLGFHIRCDDDGPDAVIRFPKPGHTHVAFLEEKVINEVRTIDYLRQNTTIPVPKILSWGLASESPGNLGPFIIMEFVEGTMASRILQRPTDDDQEALALDPDIDATVLDKFYRQVAGYLLQLSRLEFTHIGAISQSSEGHTRSAAARPLTYNLNELTTSTGYPSASASSSSFTSASTYFRHLAREHQAHFHSQRNLAADPEIARARYLARHRFPQLIDRYCRVQDDTGPFMLFCDDLRPSNMLVDPETYEITAVLDWEFTNAMPAQFSYDPPWWLLLADPTSWVDRNEVQAFRDLYEPRMQQFLRAMDAVEGETTEHYNPEHSLSAKMRDSWKTGRFWFNLASRKSLDMDAIYWRVLHDSGDVMHMLDPEARAEMEGAVEKKMAQLKDYRAEYAATHPDDD